MAILPYMFVFFVFGHFSQSFPIRRQDYYDYYDYNNNEEIPSSENDGASVATDSDGASDQLSVSATASDATDFDGASDQLSATASEDFPRWERPISFGKNDASSPLTTPFAPNIMQQHFRTAGAAVDTTMKNVSNYLGKPFVSVLPSSPSLLLLPPSFLLVFHLSPSFLLSPPSFLLFSPSSPSLLLPPSLLFLLPPSSLFFLPPHPQTY